MGYDHGLARRPLLTQSISTAVQFATEDFMAQQGVETNGFSNHELARTARIAFYGAGESGRLPCVTRNPR
ncbi:hypothetical protein V8F33_005914 [Rhypophila sp. PSN 637]